MVDTSTGPDGGKQKLSPAARRDKQARDKAAAMTFKRKKRKRENQADGQRSDSDIHHTSSGTRRRISISANRDVWSHNERT